LAQDKFAAKKLLAPKPINPTSVMQTVTETSDLPVAPIFKLAKLKEYTKPDKFDKGTFELLDYSIVIPKVKIVFKREDAVNPPVVGSMFYITGLPLDNKGNLQKNLLFKDGKDGYEIKPTVILSLKATELLDEKEMIDQVNAIPAKNLMQSLREFTTVFTKLKTDGFKNKIECKIVPINLKETLNEMKRVNPGKQRMMSKTPPVDSRDTVNKNNTLGKTRVASGAYMEASEDGTISLNAGGQGLLIDKDGNIQINGDIKKNTFGDNRIQMGMDSTPNMLADVQPKNLASAMALGPLALDRLPDFSMLNIAYKTFAVIEAFTSLHIENKNETKAEEKANPETDNRSKGNAVGKAIDKFVSKFPGSI
jgi:hypothetical protein